MADLAHKLEIRGFSTFHIELSQAVTSHDFTECATTSTLGGHEKLDKSHGKSTSQIP